MFGWFDRKKDEPSLVFPDNEKAFAHACTITDEARLGAAVPALVVEEGRRGRDGEHNFLLRLAGPGGGREIWGGTLAHAPACPEPGDLVMFRIVRVASELPDDASLIGFIACKLEPVLQPARGWRIAVNYTPEDIKPEIHF